MKSDLAFFEKKKLTVMKSNDGKYENKRFKSSRSRGGVPLFCHFFRIVNLKTQLICRKINAGDFVSQRLLHF